MSIDGTRMPNDIEPALSREQWRAVLSGKPHWVILEDVGLEPVTASFAHDNDEEGRGIILRDVEPPATLFQAKGVWGLMALCNAALPDGDPRKITREKIDALAFLVDEGDRPMTNRYEREERLAYALLETLRALIPPDDVRSG